MEATENVKTAENAETSEEAKVQKSDESLSENNKPDKAEKEQNEDKAELFRQAVLKSKREMAARAERILSLVAQFCGADKCDFDGIENAVSERNFERCRRNDMEYRLEQWQKESEEVKQTYPQFDLAKEMSDRRFFSLCYKGVGLEEAYLIVHKDELFTAAMEYAASELMRSGAFCKSGRMKEGALSPAGEFTKSEKSLSKNERKELIRRTERGERVVL